RPRPKTGSPPRWYLSLNRQFTAFGFWHQRCRNGERPVEGPRMNTVRGIDLLKRYETVLADRMTALRGIAEAFRNGTLGPLTEEQKTAMEMLERSAEKLWRDLHEFKEALSGNTGLEEVTAFVNAALEPLLEQMRARSIVLETALPSIPIRVRTGGWAGM